MKRYWVNKNVDTNPNNDHEVHAEGCHYIPNQKIDLGYHASCHGAIRVAKLHYQNVDGCSNCCADCHNQ